MSAPRKTKVMPTTDTRNIKTSTVIISQDIRQQWKILYRHGDIMRLSIGCKVSRRTVERALREGVANRKVFEHIQKYYRTVESEIVR